jgi:hypothetical protein
MRNVFLTSALPSNGKTTMDDKQFNVELVQAFQKCMAAIIAAVQAGIWQKGVRNLLYYSTDHGFGQKHGLQTLVLKTGHKSAYVRLQRDSTMGNKPDRQLVDNAVQNAINELG